MQSLNGCSGRETAMYSFLVHTATTRTSSVVKKASKPVPLAVKKLNTGHNTAFEGVSTHKTSTLDHQYSMLSMLPFLDYSMCTRLTECASILLQIGLGNILNIRHLQ